MPSLPSARVLWIVLASALAACGRSADRGPPVVSNGDSALADTLTALISEAYDFGRPDVLRRMSDLYAESNRVVSASGGQITVSADSVRAGIARFWQLAGQNMRNPQWTWDEVYVDRLSPDAAVLTGRWSLPHIALDNQAHVLEGAWTAVFLRIDGKWKILHEHLSVPSP